MKEMKKRIDGFPCAGVLAHLFKLWACSGLLTTPRLQLNGVDSLPNAPTPPNPGAANSMELEASPSSFWWIWWTRFKGALEICGAPPPWSFWSEAEKHPKQAYRPKISISLNHPLLQATNCHPIAHQRLENGSILGHCWGMRTNETVHTASFLLDSTTMNILMKHGWRFSNMFPFDITWSLLHKELLLCVRFDLKHMVHFAINVGRPHLQL